MSKSAVVLGVPHQLQGPGFQGYVPDPSYSRLVKTLMGGVDFVFEEATGRGPSIAEQLVGSSQRSVQYLDFDPTPADRPKHGIAKVVGGGWPIDPCNSSDACETSTVEEQRKREELWLDRVLSKPFEKALVIVGLAHSLSFTFRLASKGIGVDESQNYIPHSRLCTRAHVS
jgi:hypothetical protein